MSGIRLSLVVLASALLFGATTKAQTDISGAWEVTFESPQGPATIEATFMQVGESVDGMVTTPLGAVHFTGALINDALSMASWLDLQGTKIEVTLKARLTGEALAGRLAIGGLGEIPWTAKRTTDAAAASVPLPQEPTSASDVSGQWDIAMMMSDGATFATVATLKQTGEEVTGTLNGQAGSEPLTGTMVGRALTLHFRAATSQGDAAITMRGELNAEGLRGTLTIPGLGEVVWTGTRR